MPPRTSRPRPSPPNTFQPTPPNLPTIAMPTVSPGPTSAPTSAAVSPTPIPVSSPVPPAAVPGALTTAQAVSNLLPANAILTADSLESMSQAVTDADVSADLKHFFEPKLKNVPISVRRYCIVCRSEQATVMANGEVWPSQRNIHFSHGTSSSGLRNHLDKWHRALYLQLAEEHGWTIQLPSHRDAIARQAAAAQSVVQRTPFSPDGLLNRLVRFIVANDQSINVVESRQFRDLLVYLHQDVTDDDVPHRTTVRSAVIDAWRTWFVELKQDLRRALGSVSFTMDIWSSRNRASYICITSHWLSYRNHVAQEGLVLKHALLAFHPLRGRHTGVNIADIVAGLLHRAGLTGNRAHWTMDNATNNTTFLVALSTWYNQNQPNIDFHPRSAHVPCFPHIINIVTQHMINALDKTPAEFDNGIGNDNNNTDNPDGSDNMNVGDNNGGDNGDSDDDDDDDDDIPPPSPTSGIVSRVRILVRMVRASSQRQEALHHVISMGNHSGWWTNTQTGNVIKIQPRQLIRDVKTRWDSTYQMLVRAFEMHQPLLHMKSINTAAVVPLHAYLLSREEWGQVYDVITVLQHPHSVQSVMSKQKTPVLAGVVPSFERMMTKLEKLAERRPALAPAINIGLEFAYKYYKKMDETDAYIVSMFLHPGIRMWWVQKHWDNEYLKEAETLILNLMSVYRARLPAPDVVPTNQDPQRTTLGWVNLGLPSADDDDDDDEMLWQSLRSGIQTVEQEYRSYAFGTLSGSVTLDADIVAFWESRRKEFPTIFAIATDYLPIQASSVPSERAFSSSAETDTVRRNRISPILMEALQMLKFALHQEHLDFTSDLMTLETDLVRRQPGDLLSRLALPFVNAEDQEDAMDQILRSIL